MVLFWLPPESPAKMVLGMNIFTSFFVLLLLLSKNVPSAADRIPLIGAYYCLNMIMIATSTCACTVVVHIFFRGNGRVPLLIRRVFLEYLAKLYCMVPPPTLPQNSTIGDKKKELIQSPVQQIMQAQPQSASQPTQQTPLIMTTICPPNNLVQSNGNLIHQINRVSTPNTNSQSYSYIQFSSNDKINKQNSPLSNENKHLSKTCAQLNSFPKENTNLNHHYHHTLPYHNQYNHQAQSLNNELNLAFNLIENDIKEIRDYLRHTRKKLETTDSKTKQTNEWKQVALVLDRTLFFMYCIAIVVSLALMFPR